MKKNVLLVMWLARKTLPPLGRTNCLHAKPSRRWGEEKNTYEIFNENLELHHCRPRLLLVQETQWSDAARDPRQSHRGVALHAGHATCAHGEP